MIGVIGCGNMASAIVVGINSEYDKLAFLTFDKSMEKSEELASKVKGKAVESLSGLVEADFLLIGCKPQQFDEVATQIKEANINIEKKHIISMMASVSLETIKEKLGASKVTRVMPNTPIFYKKGVSLLIHSEDVMREREKVVNDFFKACSQVHELKTEALFDQVTTVTGSGPAYVYQFAQSFVSKLNKFGVEEKEARDMVIGLFEGASELMRQNSEVPLQELIDKVTSKGGVTIEAVNTYKENNLEDITSKALDNAFKRSGELTKMF